jgi:hypothetical protein
MVESKDKDPIEVEIDAFMEQLPIFLVMLMLV